MRGIAILLVLLWHSVFYAKFDSHHWLKVLMSFGRLSWSGVDLFFVLSGFLIGGILLDNRESQNFFRTFYLRRAYRILPLYFVVVIFCFLTFVTGQHGWMPVMLADWFKGPIPWWSYFAFVQNFWMVVVRGFGRAGLNVTWSLAIEEQFYLTLPFIVRRVSTKSLIVLVAGVIVGAPILRALFIAYSTRGPFAAYVLMPCRADALGWGVLCAILVRNEASWNWLLANRRLTYATVIAFGIGLSVISFMALPLFSRSLMAMEYSVLALFYASVLLAAVTAEDEFVRIVFCNRALRGLGAIAYGTYMLHSLFIDLFVFLTNFLNAKFSAVHLRGAPLAGVAVAICVAAFSWRYFEKPIVRKAHAFKY